MATAPGKLYKKNVKLGPGQVIHYQNGRYFAGPPVVAPGMAATPESVLQKQAGAQATAALAPETAEIERQRALAAQRAKGDQAALTGLAQASAEMQKGIGPGMQQGFQNAATEIGDLAKGFSGALADRVATGNSDAVAFAQSQGAPVDKLGPDAAALGNTVYGLNGFIPGASLVEQGASANAWGQALPSITAAALRGDYTRAMAEAHAQDDQYAQQLIVTAAKYPQLRNDALTALRDYEMKKAGLRADQSAAAENKRQFNASNAIQKRAQALYEKQFGETKKQNAAMNTYRVGELVVANKRAQAQLINATRKGTKIDAAASKVVGHVVDVNGNDVLGKNGKPIPVVPTGNKSVTGNRSKALSDARVKAYDTGVSLRGDPIPNKEQRSSRPGQYIAAPGAKGVFPGKRGQPATTNDPAKALRNGEVKTFADAMERAWAAVDGDGLMARYGLTRAQVRQQIRQALIRAGWKPDGKRPKPKPDTGFRSADLNP